MEWLTNPYVIIAIVVAVVVSNIMALKYTANAKFGLKYKDKPDDKTDADETHPDDTPSTKK
ncbi:MULTISPECIES: DUF2897 family protein [Salinivibrio]|jgi:hypothetical protein|uniref:DUF2897 family protein n=2 Tax=Salinivibrio TaxID=51366 RepID=A0ABY7LJ10_9GAMM|nr:MULTISPECIES: DUF2897 family protein [Salinivibrio]ODQ00920.1 hypothetical protein BGK46_04545 [Salinivibrio sp. DV]OOF21481.1 hypothetical protein BZJ17_09170 [Salinivibrio sp. IB574]OOF28431.1 hypothetical protein BZJ18_05185 [Salinivibrio sp. IB872]OOF32505.1 hypothetical protein BZJ20_01465 [Salinivibrio proteolyticus]QIR05607.1 DUF2897 family protein [Salinivibrio costicola]